jgi:hypothetical protein
MDARAIQVGLRHVAVGVGGVDVRGVVGCQRGHSVGVGGHGGGGVPTAGAVARERWALGPFEYGGRAGIAAGGRGLRRSRRGSRGRADRGGHGSRHAGGRIVAGARAGGRREAGAVYSSVLIVSRDITRYVPVRCNGRKIIYMKHRYGTTNHYTIKCLNVQLGPSSS